MISSAHENVVLKENGGIYEKGDRFKSFHWQAKYPVSRKALLVGFLSVWLKKCVVLSPPHDGILSWVLLPAVQLAHGKYLGLLPAMVCSTQRSLRALTEAFCRPLATKRGKWQVLPPDGPCPRVEIPYTYLMVWFALHCPAIIHPGEEPPEGERFAHLRRFEKSQWLRSYIVGVRKLVHRYNPYSIYRCFPSVPDAGYGEEFYNVGDGRSSLALGVFKWLISIRPSHLVYRCGDICYLESYVPSHFARQFGYGQLHVGNPNPHLAFMGSLIDGARAWRHFIVGCTEAQFCMPYLTPNLLTSLGFC